VRGWRKEGGWGEKGEKVDGCHYSGSFSIMGNGLNFVHVPGAMKSWPKLGKLPIDE